MRKIPDDLILFISGVSCVGKTSIAHNIVRLCPEFRNISEMDISRTMARRVVNDLALTNNLPMDTICKNNIYASLFESTKNNDFKIYKEQAAFFVNSITDIVKRQQARKIPTIIEGINIVPSLYFDNYKNIIGYETNIIFVNLYLSDFNAHVQRRFKRCQERGYLDDYTDTQNTVRKIVCNKQMELLNETTLLAKKVNNVFNIDTANKTIDDVSNEILDIIYKKFEK